jgi:hypothetical protein
LALGLAPGPSTITATQGSVSGATTLTVTTGTPPPPPPPSTETFTLFSSTTPPPAKIDAFGGSPLQLGLRFKADRDGHVSGVRFYKGPKNTGVHVGSLWTDAGALLAQATFTEETASGWQQVTFATPVAIKANTVYVVTYHSSGYYCYDAGYFSTPRDNPPLHPVNAGVGASLFQFGPSNTFPRSGAAGTNFWVDVVFTN